MHSESISNMLTSIVMEQTVNKQQQSPKPLLTQMRHGQESLETAPFQWGNQSQYKLTQ